VVAAATTGARLAGTFWKWLIPGVIAIAGGTALAVTQTESAVTTQLATQTAASLQAPDLSWAQVHVDGRDAVLSGTATTQAMIVDAVARVAATPGIRTVRSNVALAELLKPFPFAASTKAGQVSMSGAYPSETIHTALLSSAPGAADSTALHSGAPDGFDAAARFALAALADLDEGQIALSDLALQVEGRAKSAAAYDDLQTLSQRAPAGVTVAALKVTPPVASPYVWSAKFDGTSLVITGDAPSAALADKLRSVAPDNVPVSTTLTPASGEPAGFEANTLSLLENLLKLEQGEVAISDGTIALKGAPADDRVAGDVTAAVAAMGGKAELEPPRVAEYALSIDKSPTGLTFMGFVPDAATRAKLAAINGADVSKLALGRGAPERFASGLDFGLDALGHLTDGQFGIKGSKLSIGGRASSVADFKAVADMVGQGAPQGLSLVAAELHPPVASPFTWSATKSEAGLVTVSGYLPDDAARQALLAKIDNLAADETQPADGAPRDFAASASRGLDILDLLDSGSVTFDGTAWSIDGKVDTPQKGFAADAAYSVAGLRTAGWSYAVHLPEAQAAAPLPIISPYVWRAQKNSDGRLGFSGFVPSVAFKDFLKVRSADAADTTLLGAGAPADFGASAGAGLDALLALNEGALGLAGDRWTLTGTTDSAATRDTIQAALAAKTNAAKWQVAIQAKDAAPVVSPYLWSATKSEDGSVELSGYLPSQSLKNFAAVRAGNVSRDTTVVASGEPAGFSDDVLAGLDALGHLIDGKAMFDGSKWHLTGNIGSAADGDAAVAALKAGSKAGVLWDSAITGYPAPAAAPSEPSLAPDVTSLPPPSSESATPSAASEEALPSASSSIAEPSSSASASAPTSSEEPAANREVTPTALVPQMPESLVFDARRASTGATTLAGAVPADATAAYFAVLAGGAKTDGLAAKSGLPEDFIANGTVGLNVLAELTEGRLGFDGSRWWLAGKAEQQSVRDDVLGKVAALPNGKDWSVNVELLAPIDVCRSRVSALAGRNAIVFQAGKAALMAASMPVLDELANDLEVCAGSSVHVQGHTDADGDADANLALSVARAETVVAELIKRGVAESRLYAEGYGESDPIAPNDTKDGKAKNRRIAFEIGEE
jgi:outer membrane protein OmpA-like peptidoglycan-associated protein